MTAIRRSLEALDNGTGGCLVLEGSVGLGKSRLLAEGMAEAAQRGAPRVVGRYTELDRLMPLGVLLTALHSAEPGVLNRALVAELADLSGNTGNPLRLSTRLADAIERYAYAGTGSLLVVLDDVQWMDELTAATLRSLVPMLSVSPVLWLLASRPTARSSVPRELIGALADGGALRLPLTPLAETDMLELCTGVLGEAPDDRFLHSVRGCGGNPFLLGQLLLRRRRKGEGLETTPHLLDFQSAVDDRLRDLSPESRRLLEAGSVFSRPFTVHEVAGLLGQSALSLVPTVEEALEAGLLIEQESDLAFQHDIIRESVYTGLSGPIRRALHREAAEVVRAEGKPAAESALHLMRGVRPGAAEPIAAVRDAVLAAVREVAPQAPRVAGDMLVRLLDLMAADDPARPSLVSQAVRLLASAGRLTAARELAETMLHGELGAEDESLLLLGLAEALKHAGRDATVVEMTGRALRRRPSSEATRAQLLAVRSHALLNTSGADEADAAAAEAVELGKRAGEASATVHALAARSAAARSRGRIRDAIDLATEAVEIADEAGGTCRHRHPRLWMVRALTSADRFTEAGAVAERGQRAADELGTLWSQPLWQHSRADLWFMSGRLDDAETEAATGERIARQLTALAMLPSLLALRSRLALHRDELGLARELFDEADELARSGHGVLTQNLTWVRAQLLMAEGDGDDGDDRGDGGVALAVVAAVAGLCSDRELTLILIRSPGAARDLLRIALDLGDRRSAATVAATARRLADTNPGIGSFEAAAAHAEGVLHGDLALLRAAVLGYRSSPRRLSLATALEDLAIAEAGTGSGTEADAGDRAEAIETLGEAMKIYAESGATRDQTRVQQAMQSLGSSRRPHRATARPRSGWQSLSPSELRVVRLVSEGLTNRAVAERLFLSPHTVDTHLRHAFAKLGVSSRVGLTRQVMANDPGEDPADT